MTAIAPERRDVALASPEPANKQLVLSYPSADDARVAERFVRRSFRHTYHLMRSRLALICRAISSSRSTSGHMSTSPSIAAATSSASSALSTVFSWILFGTIRPRTRVSLYTESPGVGILLSLSIVQTLSSETLSPAFASDVLTNRCSRSNGRTHNESAAYYQCDVQQEDRLEQCCPERRYQREAARSRGRALPVCSPFESRDPCLSECEGKADERKERCREHHSASCTPDRSRVGLRLQ